jgi:DNA-binding PadR family transcriptional regulator
MSKATEPTLELLNESGVAMNPSAIIYELNKRLEDPPGESTIYRALESLQNAGYIHQPADGKSLYEITKAGKDWLDGERDAAEDAPN